MEQETDWAAGGCQSASGCRSDDIDPARRVPCCRRGIRVQAGRVALGLAASVCAGLFTAPGAQALTIRGVLSAALDQPQIHMLLRREAAGDPLTDVIGLGLFSLRPAFLDTGASGLILGQQSVDLLGVQSEPGVTVTEFGIVGAAQFGLSEQLFPAFAATSPVVDPTSAASYGQDFGPARFQVGGGSPVDIVGMPVIDGSVVVMDARPVNRFITEGVLDTLRTYLYDPGTPFDPPNSETNPGIPEVRFQVRLSFADFSSAVRVEPPGSPLPSLAANPFIGAPPTREMLPDDPPGVTIRLQGAESTGSYLLDTGAASTFISEAQVAALNVRYRPGTFGTDLPVLEFIDSGLEVPDQYRLTVGGIGGSVTASGFFVESIELQSTGGEPIVFESAPVTVLDIGTDDLTLDGVLGMNLLVGSAFFDGVNIGPFALGAFDFVVYDDVNGLLGLNPGAVAQALRYELQPGLNMVSNPLQLLPPVTAHELAARVGPNLLAVSRLGTAGVFETVRFSGGAATGPDFPIEAGAGYLLELAAPATLDLAGQAVTIERPLSGGINLVGFHATPPEFSAHDLLRIVGATDTVQSVSRLNTGTGRYESAVRLETGIGGPDFPITYGEGYLVSTLRGVVAPAVPRLIDVSTLATGP